MSAMSDLDLQLRNAIELIDEMKAAKDQWIADSTDEYGDPEIDDEDWYDGIDSYNGSLAELGLALAELVRKSLA